MKGRFFAAVLGSALLVVATSVDAPAAPATGDLVPDPSDAAWMVYADGTGARSAADLFGANASSVKGFVDAYDKTWSQPGQGLYDGLEHYSSLFWSAFRAGELRGAAQADTVHTSYRSVAGFGTAAFEVTDPADAQGYLSDTLVFSQGDYIAFIVVASPTTPDHNLLMDQANRQLRLIPAPIAEFNSIGSGVLSALKWLGGFVALNLLIAGVIVAIVLVRRRRRPTVATDPWLAALNLSPDRRLWWDGQTWIDASFQSPPSAQRSADGTFWWDGVVWRPVPSRPPS
jgi:hypothetical protein